MLVKIKKLQVDSDGHNRNISLKTMYVNTANIISISDHESVTEFLLNEGLTTSSDRFSLIKINQGDKVEDIIAHGSSEFIHASINKSASLDLLRG